MTNLAESSREDYGYDVQHISLLLLSRNWLFLSLSEGSLGNSNSLVTERAKRLVLNS
jgi:hypothetical protein